MKPPSRPDPNRIKPRPTRYGSTKATRAPVKKMGPPIKKAVAGKKGTR